MKSILAAAAAVLALSAGAASAQDAAAGEKVWNKCRACHQVGETAKNAVGPQLNGIVGRKAATAPSYAYSKAATDHAAATDTWDADELFAYLADPSAFLGGPSKMTFKLASEQERKDVIAFLATFGEDGKKK